MSQNKDKTALLKNYILNKCTPEEIEELIGYFGDTINAKDMPSVDYVLALLQEHEENYGKDANLDLDELLKAVRTRTMGKIHDRRARQKRTRLKYVSIAAMFIGIIATLFMLKKQESVQPQEIPIDAITLINEDGEIEVLEENISKVFVGRNGNVLGKQTGNQISYENTGYNDQIVYNTLVVPYGKKFNIHLSDGTMVHLNSGTSLKYPINFLQEGSRKVYLSGEAYFNVAKDTLRPFVMNSDELEVRVLGTEFNVASYPEDSSSNVVLVEGSVMMEGTGSGLNGTNVLLEPGHKGKFDKSSGLIETHEVVTDVYTSWLNGELVFREMTFDNILKKMERHFNVTIVNNNKDLADKIFNASYGEVSVTKVFEDFKETYGLSYSIEGNKIIIN